jgi:glycosyltransferase involved in cell wall biosynthesis
LVARKNIIRMLEAFHHFRHEVKSEIKLVLAGTKSWTSEGIDETIERLKLKDHVIELGYVNNHDLPVLYSGAEMFVFPSLWEGFGIPVIEAMACSTPVLTSNNSALPEVAGGAAVLIDPYSVEDIASGMYKLFSDATLRQSLRAKGLERAKFFTWRRTAQQTLEAYKRATILQ